MSIDVTQDARGVRTLWLARPDVHNAMSAHMMDAIREEVVGLPSDVRVLILAGQGKSFCAGGDLGWMRAQFDATAAERLAEGKRLSGMLLALHRCDVPIIGRLHGNAFGGGVGLASICDAAYGADHITMGLTETRLGLIPATIGPFVAARLGPRLRSVFMNSRRFDAAEAVTLGLLTRAVPADALDAAVEAEVTAYLACAPGAVADAKRQARDLGPRIDETVVEAALARLIDRWASDEAQQGISAFFNRTAPPWA
ncbi:MAG: enoyl-CoA hydratase-related protein [Pseudomonadota bacterium]